MTYSIPTKSIYTIKQGDKGIAVWAVQRICNKAGIHVTEDGDFGPKTFSAVSQLQEKLGLTLTDGIVGPGTQQAISKSLCSRQRVVNDLPDKILDSHVAWESGGYLAAVNWGTPGGVDCGLVQRRIYTGSYDDQAQIQRAFDAAYQLGLVGGEMRRLRDLYVARPGCQMSASPSPNELAWRLAVLQHNYPVAADQISRYGIHNLSGYFLTPQEWVVDARVKFPDGTPIETPLEWCQHYSLGNKAHNEPGQGVKLVTNWSL